jgi:hypothetical protein
LTEYVQVIRGNLIQLLIEDPREYVRELIVDHFSIEDATPGELTYMVKKTQDQANCVRLAIYKRLAREHISFDKFSESDRISLLINGLNDHDAKVIDACRIYLVQ